MPAIKCVTFDVTGTLLLFRTPVFEKFAQTGLKFGIKSDAETIGKNFKETWKKLSVEHPNFGKATGVGWHYWWTRYVESTFSTYVNTPEDKEKVSKIAEELIQYHTTEEAFVVRPGTEDLMDYLKSKSIKLGVISNYDPRLYTILDCTKLRKYLDFVLISYDFGYAKPDIRIFHEAVKLANGSTGSDVIHIGDDADLDYLGAKQAGLRSVLISSDLNNFTNPDINKDEVIEDFFVLKNYFKNLLHKNF